MFTTQCVVEPPAYLQWPDQQRNTLQIVLHVPEGAPYVVRDVLFAKEALAAHGIWLHVADILPWEGGVLTRELRHELAETTYTDAFHVYYMQFIPADDNDPNGDTLSGLAWSRKGHHTLEIAHTLAVAVDAPQSTLAHEIGHLMGLDHVHEDPSNIMNNGDRDASPVYSEEQGLVLKDCWCLF